MSFTLLASKQREITGGVKQLTLQQFASLGGKARAKRLTANQRRRIARKGAKARHSKTTEEIKP